MGHSCSVCRCGWIARCGKGLAEKGYSSLEAYTPFPVKGLGEELQFKRSPVPWIVFVGGVVGGVSIYALQYWVNLYAYPINVGGRPLHSWPSFIPPTFECIVLLASFCAIIGVIVLCRLPRLNHPLFEIEAFKRASTDGFFVAVRSDDEQFDVAKLQDVFTEVGASQSWEVPDV